MELQDKEKNEPVQGLGKQSTGGKDKAGLPAGRIRPSTLFYPAQHLVSTPGSGPSSLPLVKEQLHLYSPKITFSLLKATARLMWPLVKMSLTPLS